MPSKITLAIVAAVAYGTASLALPVGVSYDLSERSYADFTAPEARMVTDDFDIFVRGQTGGSETIDHVLAHRRPHTKLRQEVSAKPSFNKPQRLLHVGETSPAHQERNAEQTTIAPRSFWDWLFGKKKKPTEHRQEYTGPASHATGAPQPPAHEYHPGDGSHNGNISPHARELTEDAAAPAHGAAKPQTEAADISTAATNAPAAPVAPHHPHHFRHLTRAEVAKLSPEERHAYKLRARRHREIMAASTHKRQLSKHQLDVAVPLAAAVGAPITTSRR